MRKAELYVGSDGGAMHLATATGIRTVGLFGPGSFEVFSPVGARTIGITRNFPCSPCTQVQCIRPHDTCMHAITSDEVVIAIDRLLSDGGVSTDEPLGIDGGRASGIVQIDLP